MGELAHWQIRGFDSDPNYPWDFIHIHTESTKNVDMVWHSDYLDPCWFLEFSFISTSSSQERALLMSEITSPVKRRLPITQHRQGLSQQLEVMNAISPSSDFVTEHLGSPSGRTRRAIEATVHVSVAKFMTNESEASGDTSVCSMLNRISGQIHSAHHCSFDKTPTLILLEQNPLGSHPKINSSS